MNRGGLLLVVGAVIGAAACATPPANSSSVPGGVAPSPLPTMARVVCEDARTRVLTPTVRLQPHGVDFSIQNVTDDTLVFAAGHAGDRPGSQSEFASTGDSSVPPGVKEMRWRVLPGHARVVCTPQGKPLPRDQTVARVASLRVVDPDRLYIPVPSVLDCQGGEDHSYGLTVPVRSDDPEEPVRATKERLVGLLPVDDVARTGYPGDRYPWIKVVRSAKVVALVNIGPVIGSDSSVLWACVGSGIRPYHPPTAPERPRIPSPIPTERFPPQSKLVEGESYWVLYLAIAKKGSPELKDAIGRAHLYGYEPHVRRLECDEGAAEAYRLPKNLVGVAVYFDRERDPWHVGDAINAPHWAPTRITAHCVD